MTWRSSPDILIRQGIADILVGRIVDFLTWRAGCPACRLESRPYDRGAAHLPRKSFADRWMDLRPSFSHPLVSLSPPCLEGNTWPKICLLLKKSIDNRCRRCVNTL